MKKILFYINNLGGGGAEKVLCDIVASLDKKNYDITVMSKYDDGTYVDSIKQLVKYRPLFKKVRPGGNLFKKLFNIIYTNVREHIFKFYPKLLYHLYIKQKFDIEIAFLEGYSTKVISGSNNKNSKKITWVHADLKQNHWTKECYRSFQEEVKCYKKFNTIVCVSESVAENFKEFYAIKQNVIVKHNPVNKLDILSKANEAIDFDKEQATLTLVTVGRLVYQKGYDRLLKVCKILKDEGFNFNLWIVGEGEQRNLLEKYISENDMEDTVELLGFQSNPYKYIRHADLFVCSSRTEGFSLVVVEAMIIGVPIISTKCAGPNELLDYGEYGMLVGNDEDSLYNGIKNVLLNRAVIKRYETKAKRKGEYFSIENTLLAIEEIF